MATRLSDRNLRWLLSDRPPLDALATRDITDGQLDLPPSVGRGTFRTHHLPNGCTLGWLSHRFAPGLEGRLFTLGEVTMQAPEPYFTVQVMRGGHAFHEELTAKAQVLFDDEHDAFGHFERREVISRVEAVGSDMAAVIVPLSALDALLGKDLAARLLAGLGIATRSTVAIRRTPSALGDVLHGILRQPIDSPVARLEAQEKLLDYLSALAAHVTAKAAPERRTTGAPRRAHALHERLLRLEGKLPTLSELAAEYGCSARTLNAEFLRVYGETITDFIVRSQFEEAHEVLRSSDVPMKVLADRLGYSHVNHFIHAFKRRFGYPPGQVRAKTSGRGTS